MRITTQQGTAFPIFPNTVLRFRLWSLTNTIKLNVCALIRRTNGELVPIEKPITSLTTGLVSEVSFLLVEGELISVTLSAQSDSDILETALVFVECTVGSGSEISTAGVVSRFTKYATLFSGYPSNSSVGWIMGNQIFSGEKPVNGYPINTAVASPVTDGEYQYTVPNNSIERVNAVRFDFTASVIVATRRVGIDFYLANNGDRPIRYYVQGTITAGAGRNIQFIRGLGYAPSGTSNLSAVVTEGIGEFILDASNAGIDAGSINTHTENRDADDTYSNIIVQTERWIRTPVLT